MTDPALTHVPLCVDLDGTLTRHDTLWLSMRDAIRRRPALACAIPCWYLRHGRAILKCRLAAYYLPSPASLSYHQEFLDYLRIQRERKRRLILVTGAHRLIAESIGNYLGLFDECLGTLPDLNLSGKTKRDVLVQRFGEQGFDYAGNHRVDLPVWEAARSIIIVHASPRVRRRAESLGKTEEVFD